MKLPKPRTSLNRSPRIRASPTLPTLLSKQRKSFLSPLQISASQMRAAARSSQRALPWPVARTRKSILLDLEARRNVNEFAKKRSMLNLTVTVCWLLLLAKAVVEDAAAVAANSAAERVVVEVERAVVVAKAVEITVGVDAAMVKDEVVAKVVAVEAAEEVHPGPISLIAVLSRAFLDQWHSGLPASHLRHSYI